MICFGPAGNSESFYAQGHKSTIEQPKWLYDLGLNAYEYSFGHGVRLSEKTGRAMGEEFQKYHISVSIHAPYYINFATEDPQKQQNSTGYILQCAQAARYLGAKRIVFHPGVQGKGERKEAVARITEGIERTLTVLDDQGYSDLTLCPESMGKIGQIGDLTETIDFCRLGQRLIPCIDFGHLYARSLGSFQGKEAYQRLINEIGKHLGEERLRQLHIHFSRIEYTKGGEKRHWTYRDTQWGPDIEPLLELIVAHNMEPVVICESSGTMAEDAKTYQALYEQEVKRQNERPCE